MLSRQRKNQRGSRAVFLAQLSLYLINRVCFFSWNVDNTRFKFRPALLHVEVVPFFHGKQNMS